MAIALVFGCPMPWLADMEITAKKRLCLLAYGRDVQSLEGRELTSLSWGFQEQVVVEKHRHEGIFVARGKEDALVTKNLVPGESVYGEKRISTEVCAQSPFLPPTQRFTVLSGLSTDCALSLPPSCKPCCASSKP